MVLTTLSPMSKIPLTVRPTRATEAAARLLPYAPQQQEENVSEHKHVCLLSGQSDGELDAKGWKERGKDFTLSELP